LKFGGTKNAGPIGLDIAGNQLHLIQIEPHGSRGKIIAAAQRKLPDGLNPRSNEYHEAVAQLVNEAVSRGGFVGRQMVTSLPAEQVQLKNMRMPCMPYDDLREAVRWEVQERMAEKGQTLSVRFFDAGEVRQGDETRREVIAVACDQYFAQHHVDALNERHFELLAVETTAATMARSARMVSDEDRPVLMLDIGPVVSTLIITSGERVLFGKSIHIGSNHIDESVSKHLELPVTEAGVLRKRLDNQSVTGKQDDSVGEDAQRAVFDATRVSLVELAKEVSLCVRYFGVTFRGEKPNAIHMTGIEASSAWLHHVMSEVTGIEPYVVDPFETYEAQQVLPSVGQNRLRRGHWSSALGAARRVERRTVSREAAA